MKPLMIALLIGWIVAVFTWVIRTNKWVGVLQCGLIVCGSTLAALGKNTWALVFVGIVVVAFMLALTVRQTEASRRQRR
jgi:general stress protein CsbA